MTIVIIGLGLIGGSFARDLRDSPAITELIGVETNPEHLRQALELGLVDRTLPLEQAIQAADVVVLAVPVNTIDRLLPQILDQATSTQTVIDLGSTKQQMIENVKAHPNRGRYVAAHPMAGTENSGPAASFKGLFKNKTVLLCDLDHSAPDACKTALELFHIAGLKFEFMDAVQHDRHAAYVSHLSHIVAYALSLAVQNEEKAGYAVPRLAGGGFASTVRLAMSSSDSWVPIITQNRENILTAVYALSEKLEEFKRALETNDESKLRELIDHANKIRELL
ncbi:MAG: prephenate dehydrogenase [Kiritimatiellae bacterium]|nr:prephenate dehydrogenase [Kiritimatiellia bacterium]